MLVVAGEKLLNKFPFTAHIKSFSICPNNTSREENDEIAKFENFHEARSRPEWQRKGLKRLSRVHSCKLDMMRVQTNRLFTGGNNMCELLSLLEFGKERNDKEWASIGLCM